MSPSGLLYLADGNRIRVISNATSAVTTLAGTLVAAFANGFGTNALFSSPSGVAFNASGFAIVGDTGNALLRAVDPLGSVTTLAGTGAVGAVDGAASSASFSGIAGVTELAGVIYGARRGSCALRCEWGVCTCTGGNRDRAV